MAIEIKELLVLIGETCRQRRIALGETQANQAELAEISLKALQNIEAGHSGQTAVLMKYLNSLGMLDVLSGAFPDPFVVTPIEELALKEKVIQQRPKRVSRRKMASEADIPRWGDEE